MTVSTTTNSVVLTANDVTTVFPYSFLVLDADHLVVERRVVATGLVDKTYTSGEYTVSGVGTASGSVTFSTAPASGNEIIITRRLPYTQALDLVNQGGFYPETVEEALDLMVMQTQQVSEEVGRAIKVIAGETPTVAVASGEVVGNVNGVFTGVENSAVGAASSASEAAAWATAASTSATNSATSATASASSATDAQTAEDNAETAQAAAETARDAAIAAIAVDKAFTDTTIAAAITAGLAATTSGDQFVATGDDVDYIGLYEDNAGTEDLQFSFAKIGYLADLIEDLRYATNDARQILKNIYNTTTTSGSAGSYSGRQATVAANSRNSFFFITDTLDQSGNITTVIRPPVGTTFNTDPYVAVIEWDGITLGTFGQATLQADGTYVYTGAAVANSKQANIIRVDLDSRTLGAITAEISSYEGDYVPATAEVPLAISSYVDEADDSRLTKAQVRSEIATMAPFENHVASGDTIKTWILNQCYANCAYVDYENGSDANAGTYAAPFKTLGAAVAVSSWVALRAGQRHIVDDIVEMSATTSGDGWGALVPYGAGAPPIVDGRKDLSGETWTAVSGRPGVYKLDVTLGDDIIPGGAAASNTHFAMYELPDYLNSTDVAGTRFEWQVGGASISANLDDVEAATASSFTVHAQGETTEDPRDGTYTGRDVTFYIRLLDDDGNVVDPNGRNIFVPHNNRVFASTGCDVVGIDFVGNIWKDLVSSNAFGTGASTRFNNWIDVRGYETAAHFIVGPGHLYGYVESYARAIEESGATYSGGALHVAYTATDYSSTHDLIIGARIKATNHGKVLYAHGSGNNLYRQYLMLPGSGVDCTNCNGVFNFDSSVAPIIVTRNMQATECQTMIDHGGDGTWNHYEDERGCFASYTSGVGGWAAIQQRAGTGTVHIRNVDFEFAGVSGGGTILNHLIARSVSGDDPTLVFDGCADITEPEVQAGGGYVRGGIFRRATLSGADAADVKLVLINSQMGDFQDLVGGTNYPVSLTVDANSTFGLGSRKGGTIETALTGASVTHSIDHDSTVVAYNGQVLDAPGW